MLKHLLELYSFLLLNNIPLYVYATVCLSTHLFGIWLFLFWLWSLMLQWTLVYKYLSESLFSILLVFYLEVELLDHIVSNFSRNHLNVFQSSCTILHSHQQFIRVPVALHFTSTFLFLIIVILVDMGFPGDSHGKESTYNAGDPGLIPELGRSPRGGHGNPLKYSCLENPHEQKNLASYSPWGHKESDTTEWLSTS